MSAPGPRPQEAPPGQGAGLRARLIFALFVLCSASFLPAGDGDSSARELRYRFKLGDRHLFRETYHRTVVKRGFERAIEGVGQTWVAVVEARSGLFTTAVQRNREDARLTRQITNDKDITTEEAARFATQRAGRPRAQAEANRCNLLGEPLFPGSAVRNWYSELLQLLPEIVPLPRRAVKPGDEWVTGPVDFRCRAQAIETLDGRECLHFTLQYGEDAVKGDVWFDLAAGIPLRQAYTLAYPSWMGQVQETLRLDWQKTVEGESPLDWLQLPELRQGVESALLLPGSAVPDPVRDALARLLPGLESPEQERIMAIFLQRDLVPPPAAVLNPFLDSPSPRARTLAVRLLARGEDGPDPAALRRAAQDKDFFVRSAAERALHRLAAPLTPRPARKPAALPPGCFMLPMGGKAFAGWPYVIYLPEDYRGDEPFPLLVFLTGGDGQAIPGALGTLETVRQAGFVTVFPQARGMWWDKGRPDMVLSLIDEIRSTYCIDPDRIYLVGVSNGGTGVFACARLWGERLAAGVSLEGAGIDGPPASAGLSNLNNLPLLFIHGEKDPVIPVRGSLDTVAALKKCARDAVLEMRVLKGRGHDLSLGADDDLSLEFLLRQVRKPYPRRLDFELLDPAFPRHYWVAVTAPGPGPARVQGEITAEGEIRLQTRNVLKLRLYLDPREFTDPQALHLTLNGRQVVSQAVSSAPAAPAAGETPGRPEWVVDLEVSETP